MVLVLRLAFVPSPLAAPLVRVGGRVSLVRSSEPTRERYDVARTKDREQWHSTVPGGSAFCVGCWWCSGSFEEWAMIERRKMLTGPPVNLSDAVFSECRTWRYELYRRWDSSAPTAMFIGLNPSTADETENDPTVRRCINFARDWGFGGLLMCNIYALRSTDPKGLWLVEDPVGPENDQTLIACAQRAGVVVAAWGVHARPDRVERVRGLIPKLRCLGRTKFGAPKHPLYLKSTTGLETYDRR